MPDLSPFIDDAMDSVGDEDNEEAAQDTEKLDDTPAVSAESTSGVDGRDLQEEQCSYSQARTASPSHTTHSFLVMVRFVAVHRPLRPIKGKDRC